VEHRNLGESGVEVPAVGLATWQVLDGRGRREQARHEVVPAALEEGANLFDSSPMYGEAERGLGDALSGRGRERAIVATKVWTSNGREAERQVERSLGYFGGRIELYQVHNLVAVESRLDALRRLKDEEKVRAVGATHYSCAAFSDLMSVMRSGRVDFVQVPYNAAETSPLRMSRTTSSPRRPPTDHAEAPSLLVILAYPLQAALHEALTILLIQGQSWIKFLDAVAMIVRCGVPKCAQALRECWTPLTEISSKFLAASSLSAKYLCQRYGRQERSFS
jgi:Aldo/keto reductase family